MNILSILSETCFNYFIIHLKIILETRNFNQSFGYSVHVDQTVKKVKLFLSYNTHMTQNKNYNINSNTNLINIIVSIDKYRKHY